MATRETILAFLEQNKGIYFSGEELAERLGISRTAVWKVVSALRSEGYPIDAVRNRGYCLSTASDILSRQGIEKYLESQYGLQVEVHSVVPSTNMLLREQAAAGAPEGTVIIAAAQTAGRGRIGRSFVSPPDTGIYLSLLLRPQEYSPQKAIHITTMAAVAACEAIESIHPCKAEIKWVNDIYLDGKKVSGILTEGSFGMETGFLEYVVLGIGINVYPPKDGFPEELRSIAGAIFQEPQNDGKNRLAAQFLNNFMARYRDLADTAFSEEYRRRSFVIGKAINVISPLGSKPAVALDVDDQCRLLVRYPDGTEEALATGEISVRLQN